MSGLKKRALQVGFVILRIVYAPLKLLPIRRKYLFITKLADTPPLDFRLLARSLQVHHPDHEVVMLCRRMDDKPRYVLHMFTQMYHLATSEVVFLDRSCLVVHILHHKKKLQVVQLWHAIGSMKRFGYAVLDTPEGEPRELARICHMHENYTYILISSKAFLKDYKEGFNTDGSNVIEIPLPKTDLLVDEEYQRQRRREILRELPGLSGKRTILYCPTFRKTHMANTDEKITELVNCVDFEHFNLVYQPHPLSPVRIDDERVIITKRGTFDMLSVADVVISDYSSVIYEAGLRHLPVYLYTFDWDTYREARTLNIDIEDDIPAMHSRNARVLIDAIEHDSFDYSAFGRFIERNVRLPHHGTCCDAIVSLIDRPRQKVEL